MTINYEEFSKIEIRIGTIKTCVPVEKSNKLLKLEVDFGEMGTRQVLAGLAQSYKPEELVNLQTLFVTNMEPRKMVGLESQAMILVAGLDLKKKPSLIKLSEPTFNGDGVC